MSKPLIRPIPAPLFYSIAALLSTIIVLDRFSLDYLLGTSGFWFDLRNDPAQHVTGYWAFANGEWQFPLLNT